MAKRRPSLLGKVREETNQLSYQKFSKRLKRLALDIIKETEAICKKHRIPMEERRGNGYVATPESSAVRDLLTEAIVSTLRFDCAMTSLKRLGEACEK